MSGVLLLGTPGTASASTMGGSITYSCQFGASSPTGKGAISQDLNIGVDATAPATVAPGGSVSLSSVQTSTIIPASLVTTLMTLFKVTDFQGTVVTFDFAATNATPATLNSMPSGGIGFSYKVKKNTAVTIVVPSTPTTVGPFTAGSSGTMTIVPGNVVISTTIGGSKSYVVCTPPASIPAAETASITIKQGAPTVPATNTGEPWSGWLYWAIIAAVGALGLVSFGWAFRIRSRKA